MEKYKQGNLLIKKFRNQWAQIFWIHLCKESCGQKGLRLKAPPASSVGRSTMQEGAGSIRLFPRISGVAEKELVTVPQKPF